jgi:hypothetical protein
MPSLKKLWSWLRENIFVIAILLLVFVTGLVILVAYIELTFRDIALIIVTGFGVLVSILLISVISEQTEIIERQTEIISNQTEIANRQTELIKIDKKPFIWIQGSGDSEKISIKVYNHSKYPIEIVDVFADGKRVEIEDYVIEIDEHSKPIEVSSETKEVKIKVANSFYKDVSLTYTYDTESGKFKKIEEI